MTNPARRAYQRQYYLDNREKILQTSQQRYKDKTEEIRQQAKDRYYDEDHYVAVIIDRCRQRARIKGLKFDLIPEDVIIPDICPILKIPLIRSIGIGKPTANSPSVDRIDPREGYISTNIQIISYKANCMKNNASVQELLLFADWIYAEYGQNSIAC